MEDTHEDKNDMKDLEVTKIYDTIYITDDQSKQLFLWLSKNAPYIEYKTLEDFKKALPLYRYLDYEYVLGWGLSWTSDNRDVVHVSTLFT